jgi:ribose transport system ATP-binding protein
MGLTIASLIKKKAKMRVDLLNIYKSFGANDVLKDVNFNVQGGEICALIGENGAGKSTLMNILGGVHQPDQGQIVIDGKVVQFLTPADSLNAGIGFIHQELNLINDLNIYENMFIGRELTKSNGMLDRDTMIAQTAEIFDRLGLDIDPRTMVKDLDSSYKQVVEISRALLMKASIIIMDEPTSSLTVTEIQRVFNMMRTLREQNVGIVFISHKLNEVMQICDRYVVLRDGEIAGEGNIDEVHTGDLARMMVGHEIRVISLQREKEDREEALRVEALNDGHNFYNISFSVRKGEVLGITGLLGDGRSELFQSIFGAGTSYRGQVYLHGEPIRIINTTDAVEKGLAYLPRNRKENGIIKDMSVLENASVVIWPYISKFGFINTVAQTSFFDSQVKKLQIKLAHRNNLITSLSGGNQQKVVLAKWLSKEPSVLILDNPTQGVDVGAKEEIYDIILNLADEGVAVIVLSSEAQEIIRVCDRTLVMFHGHIQGELSSSEMNEHEIMRLATGLEEIQVR